jgi:hypothetical protein
MVVLMDLTFLSLVCLLFVCCLCLIRLSVAPETGEVIYATSKL